MITHTQKGARSKHLFNQFSNKYKAANYIFLNIYCKFMNSYLLKRHDNQNVIDNKELANTVKRKLIKNVMLAK